MRKIIHRIKEFSDLKGITFYKMQDDIGASRGVLTTALRKGTDISSKWIPILHDTYPDLNINWLISGEGNPILGEKNNLIKEAKTTNPILGEKNNPIKEIKTTNQIPLVNILAIGGIGNANFNIGEQDVKEYYTIPKFQNLKIDFMIEVNGSSMYPKYNSGDVVACRIIKESQFIQWNKTHIIATKEQGILIKRIKKSTLENHITAISDNSDYDPFDIPDNEITGVALVMGVVRLE